MKLYEPLFVEHHLIERLFKVIEKEISLIKSKNKVNRAFINMLADFFITYIDVYHHGKEENILFKELGKKKISIEHKDMMQKLLREHVVGRNVIEELIKSTEAYANGSQNEIDNIIARLRDFVDLYTQHIKEEDDAYFIDVMQYFTQAEQDELIQNFWRYTIKLMDKKYEAIIDLLEEQ